MFPLYEVENGAYKLTFDSPKLRPVADYMKLQGRFRHLPPDVVEEIQTKVIEKYERLRAKAVR